MKTKGSICSIPDWHHSERNIFRAHVISAFNFVDFISLRHNNAMMLQNNCV